MGEYMTKVLGGRKTKGCFARETPAVLASAQDAKRVYLHGRRERDQDLNVVPHFRLWDPEQAPASGDDGKESGEGAQQPTPQSMPYEFSGEPLGREAWVTRYPDVAPRIQRVVDEEVARVKDFGSSAEDFSCSDDVPAVFERALSVLKECRHVQETAKTLMAGEFPSAVPDGEGHYNKVACIEGGQGQCEALNCHAVDKDLVQQLTHLRARARACRDISKAMRSEERARGPAPFPEVGEDREDVAEAVQQAASDQETQATAESDQQTGQPAEAQVQHGSQVVQQPAHQGQQGPPHAAFMPVGAEALPLLPSARPPARSCVTHQEHCQSTLSGARRAAFEEFLCAVPK